MPDSNGDGILDPDMEGVLESSERYWRKKPVTDEFNRDGDMHEVPDNYLPMDDEEV